ncbi:rRNA maturation RNase YbeY [Candidatus Parcubacteria bacterium]|nr:rRNA maturation RNase YbeY [Patescibacteria group bacterium]MBU4309938.1 rRNA maturation RNase YbeY [Patescibacteria group bacterium]MBU4432248.1 rRNA maturation RNase YbeY [Patescibacteria group bacterium]MBU4577863.1 rRNA maturation RNase YbeY [Patescibacteria group bacterium]MCG2696924.1 rRNA maturation RNase YbeY [Candidatus Parcubacteria bacterium]
MVDVVNKTRSNINLKLVEKVSSKFLELIKEKRDVSIVFVGDKRIQDLNKSYRHKDKVTDILSFDGDRDFFGEIIIDYAQIKRQAKIFSKSVKDELVFILIHGLLHLQGYDDKTEKGRLQMEKLGESFVKKIKY